MRPLPAARMMLSVLTLVLCLWPSLCGAVDFGGGTGDPNDPYRIATAEQLIGLGETPDLYDKHFVLVADIDLSGYVYDRAVIAPDTNAATGEEEYEGIAFTGTVDGGGHEISGLTVSGTSYLGLFGMVGEGGQIHDLDLVGVELTSQGSDEENIGALIGTNYGQVFRCFSEGLVSGGDDSIGGLVGRNCGAVEDCSSTATVFGDDDVGGLVGLNEGTLTRCSSSAVVFGDNDLGGLVGQNDGVIVSCHSDGRLRGDRTVGGLCGQNNHRISHCDSAATAGGNLEVGGLVGKNRGGVIISSHSTGSVRGDEELGYQIGGLVGRNDGHITVCSSAGTVQGSNGTGGLAGSNDGFIHTSYSTGTVRGRGTVGGLVGSNGGLIAASHSSSSVSGQNTVGGLVGWNSWHAHVVASYSIGSAVGDEAVGGLIGHGPDSKTVSSFWDKETSGQVSSAGGTGLTTIEMQDLNTYLAAGWDLVGETSHGTSDYWEVLPGDYPILRGHSGDGLLSMAGSGTIQDPYLIRSAQDLGNVWLQPWACFRLEQSIDLTSITWSGAVAPYFWGRFDGNGHVLENLCIRGAGDLGLFGRLGSGAVVSNLGLEAVDVNGVGIRVGGLAGRGAEGSRISGSYSTGSVVGLQDVGGLVGENDGSIISSYSTAAVGGSYIVGGLVGDNEDGTIISSHSHGTITGGSQVGGLVGHNDDGAILSSHSQGTVSGTDQVGGLVGEDEDGMIVSSHSTCRVTGRNGVGGLVGQSGGSVSSSYSTGAVDGDNSVGGLIGSSDRDGNVRLSHSTGTVVGVHEVGGLVGRSNGSIISSYSMGSVNGDSIVGGLVGQSHGTIGIVASYSAGAVTGRQTVGGLVGFNIGGGIVMSYSMGAVKGDGSVGGFVGEAMSVSIGPQKIPAWTSGCFWDVQASGLANSAGGTGLTTVQMQTVETYLQARWDLAADASDGTCDYWQMSPGEYPRLHYHTETLPVMPEGRGTEDQPYLIRDAGDLGSVWFKPVAHYLLAGSVDLSEIKWSGAVVPWFNGTFDGQGFAIQGLRISGESDLGLFGSIANDAEVHDLSVTNANVTSIGDDSENIGLLAGVNDGDVTQCHSHGVVTGQDDSIGGLVGRNDNNIRACSSSATVSGDDDVGGLVGWNRDDIEECFSTGTVSGDNDIGGCVGQNNGRIVNCYSTGDVSGDSAVGGIVGQNGRRKDRGRLYYCYSTGAVAGNEGVGGLVGWNNGGRIRACYWDTETSGQDSSSDGGTGYTTAEMMTLDTFQPWIWGGDGAWVIQEAVDYPRLHWQNLPGVRLEYRYAGEGEGTPEAPYLIFTAEDLLAINRQSLRSKAFKLMADIDMDPAVLQGLSSQLPVIGEFSGLFDGNGHAIKNLIGEGSFWVGLFGSLRSGAEVRDLVLTGINITATDHPNFNRGVGGLAGENKGNVIRCYGAGTVSGPLCVGGLIGLNKGTVRECHSDVTVSGLEDVGGLVGRNGRRILSSGSTGMVTGQWRVGGLVGYNSFSGQVTGARYRDGGITGEVSVGGLVGVNAGNLSASYSTGSVIGDHAVGGLVGQYDYGSVTTSYSAGAVNGNVFVGGLVGRAEEGYLDVLTATASFWDMNASGQTHSAGGTGLTTTQMQTGVTFIDAGWDFMDETENGTQDFWWIDEGQDAPWLWWESDDTSQF